MVVEWESADNKKLKGTEDTGERAREKAKSLPQGLMLEHNGRQGSKGVDISYSPPPLAPPALQLTSWQP